MFVSDEIIIGNQLKKSYESISILDVEHITIKKNAVTSIVGPSGAGKSTLLHILGTLLKPTSGQVLVDNLDINSLNDKEIAKMRNNVFGFIFQFHNLLPEFNAIENICLPAMISNTPKDIYTPKAKELLLFLGLKDRMTHKPSQLSGGEQQRVAIARALINSPKIVFADEPTGNLDTANAVALHEKFVSLNKEFGHSFLIVTHNPQMAAMSDHIVEMRDGKLI